MLYNIRRHFINNELINNDNKINNFFNDIKDLVINNKNKVYQTVNTKMLNPYWNIGKIIMEIQQVNVSNLENNIYQIKLIPLFRTY